ncbi:hypothetical protein [Haladaptatus salinisoli]|uniref:hypothetical protein n=1 Tax=Haladaptatus salinisoli TaxID=2884876 RepID=UPI001D0B027E|nr:hypothetical protein [Haladaptatus salinisoli]
MRDQRRVRTERGALSVRDGRLRVRTTPRSVLGGIRLQKWRRASAIRRALFLLSLLSTGWGFYGLASTAMRGGPDEWLPYALLWGGFAFVVLGFLGDARRRNVTIPLRTISRVERSADGSTLRVVHAEDGDAETTDIEFVSDSGVEKAAERLRWKGVRVSETSSDRRPAAEGYRERLREGTAPEE